MRVGADYQKEKCRFAVWAPYCSKVALKLVGTGELLDMEKAADGYWQLTVHGIKAGAEYLYLLDGKAERPDPASQYQPKGVFGPSMVVDQEAYTWKTDWNGLDFKDFIFYEVHVGTFTSQGTFKAIIDSLEEIADIGINAVELMPVAQFPGERNWGYDTAYPFAVQNSYGTPNDFKKLVDECHQLRLALFIDAVYNHAGPEGNFLNEFGPYFLKNRMTAWGPTINLDGPMCQSVREYFLQNTLHWFKNYRLDGVRLDAVLSMPDSSPQHFLQDLTESVHDYSSRISRKSWLVAESGFNEPCVLGSIADGGFAFDAQWLDDFQHAIFSLITGEHEGYYQNYGTMEDVIEVLTEVYAYVGTRPMFHRRRRGESFSWIPSARLVVFSQNHDQVGNRLLSERITVLSGHEAGKLAAGLVLLSPYVPLLFMGEEYGETAPFNFFVDYADKKLVAATRDGRIKEFAEFHWTGEAPDPGFKQTFEASKLNWHLRDEGKYNQILAYYKALIGIRKRLLDDCFVRRYDMKLEAIANQKVLLILRCQNNDANIIVANFSKGEQAFEFPLDGEAYSKVLDSSDTAWGGPGSLLPSILSRGKKVRVPGYSFAFYEKHVPRTQLEIKVSLRHSYDGKR